MYPYMCIYICICMSVIYVFVYLRKYIYIYICFLFTYLFIYYIYMYTHIYFVLYVCIRIYDMYIAAWLAAVHDGLRPEPILPALPFAPVRAHPRAKGGGKAPPKGLFE